MSRVRLRFFDHNGTELDTVIIWRDGNCASIRAHSAWVEVTIVEDEAAPELREQTLQSPSWPLQRRGGEHYRPDGVLCLYLAFGACNKCGAPAPPPPQHD